MNDSVVSIFSIIALLLGVGGIIGLLDKGQFSMRWLLVAAALVLANDAALTNLYGLLPDMLGGHWNWQGKLLALVITLAIATLPAFGWRECGLTLKQNPGSLRSGLPLMAIYVLLFISLAIAFPGDPASHEDVAFQLTMPGLEEESFYRGVLLFALNEAFRSRIRVLGVDWGWGAVLSCTLFGLAHAFSFSDGQYSFDILTMALTGLPAFIAVWLREKTGSILMPLLLHNFGNSISLIV